jgi:hypothetical protein
MLKYFVPPRCVLHLLPWAILTGIIKYGSGFWKGMKQGKQKNKDQIQLRGEFLEKYSQYLLPAASVRAVVGLSLFPQAFVDTAPAGITFVQTTWEEVCLLPAHPNAEEVQRYFTWKKENTRLAEIRENAS